MRAQIVTAAILLGSPAWAIRPKGPLATLQADVDGDGASDALAIDVDGVLKLTGARPAQLQLAPRIIGATLAATRYRGKTYVTARLMKQGSEAPVEEAVIVVLEGGSWRELVRIALGGIGLDHDHGVEVDAAADGIYRYQTRADVHRCDGKPAYLFAEKWDGARFRRTSALPSGVAAGVPVLAAHKDGAAGTPAIYQARAASHQIGAGDAGGLAIPKELDDGRPDTAWREELAASTGEGQFFTFEPRVPDAKAQQLRVLGVRGANRVKRLAIVAATGAWRAELPDDAAAMYAIDLPQPVAGCVTVILETTYGPAQGTTQIAELEVFAEGERAGGGDAVLARAIAEGGNGATAATAALARKGAAGVAAIEQALATADAAARRRLAIALIANRDAAAAGPLAKLVGELRGRDLLEAIHALGALAPPQVMRELAGDRALAGDVRRAAITHLRGLAELIELDVQLAGEPLRAAAAVRESPTKRGQLTPRAEVPEGGARELRQAVIEQLRTLPADALIAAARAQAVAAVAGDLWRAAARSRDRAAVLPAMLAALPAAQDYERRYRLVDGVAALGDAAALQALAAMLGALPDGAERAALQQVALHAMAAAPRAEATPRVIAAASDRDPGVRLAALGALASATEGADATEGGVIDGVLANALAKDGWPEVRRRAAGTLGGRCQRPGPASALVAAIDHDADLVVRGDALSALVQCHAPGAAGVLARVWSDGKLPVELRTRAVLEAIPLGDGALGAQLVGKFVRWRAEAITSEPALALAQAAAAAIAKLAAPGAVQALTDALDDSAFPEIVQAAALGLGALGPACPAAAKAKLFELASSEDASALVARRAAAQCGG